MGGLLSRFLALSGETRVSVIDAEGDHSYDEIVAGALAIAGALVAERGRHLHGERVAMLVGPRASFVMTFFGILLAGGTVVVLSPLHPPRESAYFCDDAGVNVVLVSKDLDAHAAPLVPHAAVSALGSMLAHPGLASPATSEPDAPALQLYTSGTTGRPKGAVLTHANLTVQQELVGRAWGFSERDALLHTLPLHHMHGLAIALLTALGAGATTRFAPFDAASVWDTLASATVFMGVPAMYHRLLGAFDAADEPTRDRWRRTARQLRLATSGSAALPVTLATRWAEIAGVIPLERFGMTEIGVGLTNLLDGPRHAGCVGLPLPTVDTRIVDERGADAETGELWVRGPSVFSGYHRRPEETARAFVDAKDGGRPWFRTGDTVTRDAIRAGAPFRVLGRTSVDILKSGGYKLSALEIEEVLREDPGVFEVAVVGVPDEAWGERVVACVVPREGTIACTEASLRAFARDRLAPYKVPKEIVFVAELPKNTLGKVLKPALVATLTGR